ncbi:NAD(P)-binding protein [Mytilinidion resinicola]|uniref:NAD(P)-binding protein n=1 Tax=Mytilinidion resinicola TaxID=574789 RepID=A0A6A6Z6F5_9PEZI|nr:NAD(P)-binding protein [Mytilinidion resinicola]KAF2815815.1 NAD(P)-binding protein [Mytilinidion resinicola]
MSTPLAGKVAIVTGGSKGIGAATVVELAKQGAKVVINFSSDATPAEELVKQIGPDNALTVKADAASVAGIEELVKQTVAKFGRIDILIPNAGVLPMKDLESTTEADFDRTFAINVKGPYFLAQKAAPHMSEGGHIVFLSTSLCAASTVAPNYLLYNSTKGAIEQMTRVMAKDLGRKGISVNAVAPGPTATELFMRGKPEQVIKTIAGLNPFNRIGTPEEVAQVIVMLSSGASQWVNGQVLRANGGFA